MIKIFRLTGLVEGITTLALFGVAMPLKYFFGHPELVPPVGMIHGLAFVGYIVVMLMTLPSYKFSGGEWARTALAAVVPFGTFLNDPFLKRKQVQDAAQA